MFILTWLTGLILEDVRAMLPEASGYKINAWTEMHEGGGEHDGLLHTHCVVRRSRAEDRTTASLKMGGVMPDFKPSKGPDHAQSLLKYHLKQGDEYCFTQGPDGRVNGIQLKIIMMEADDVPVDRSWFIANLHTVTMEEFLTGVLQYNLSREAAMALRTERQTVKYKAPLMGFAWHKKAWEIVQELTNRQVKTKKKFRTLASSRAVNRTGGRGGRGRRQRRLGRAGPAPKAPGFRRKRRASVRSRCAQARTTLTVRIRRPRATWCSARIRSPPLFHQIIGDRDLTIHLTC